MVRSRLTCVTAGALLAIAAVSACADSYTMQVRLAGLTSAHVAGNDEIPALPGEDVPPISPSEHIDPSCYTAPVGTLGAAPGCLGMLIVDRAMLDSAQPVAGSVDLGITHEGELYTFGNSDRNIFTGQVTSMYALLRDRHQFNADIGYWDTSQVTDMAFMFQNARDFNQPIEQWDTSRVALFYDMFQGASRFNQPLNDWDTSSAERTHGMFFMASAFNQPLDRWDMSGVVNMNSMFRETDAFNQDISMWRLDSQPSMARLFLSAQAYNQDLSCLDVAFQDSRPINFDTGALSWTLSRPNWGATVDPACQ